MALRARRDRLPQPATAQRIASLGIGLALRQGETLSGWRSSLMGVHSAGTKALVRSGAALGNAPLAQWRSRRRGSPEQLGRPYLRRSRKFCWAAAHSSSHAPSRSASSVEDPSGQISPGKRRCASARSRSAVSSRSANRGRYRPTDATLTSEQFDPLVDVRELIHPGPEHWTNTCAEIARCRRRPPDRDIYVPQLGARADRSKAQPRLRQDRWQKDRSEERSVPHGTGHRSAAATSATEFSGRTTPRT
jgi:hypothetical protein